MTITLAEMGRLLVVALVAYVMGSRMANRVNRGKLHRMYRDMRLLAGGPEILKQLEIIHTMRSKDLYPYHDDGRPKQ